MAAEGPDGHDGRGEGNGIGDDAGGEPEHLGEQGLGDHLARLARGGDAAVGSSSSSRSVPWASAMENPRPRSAHHR